MKPVVSTQYTTPNVNERISSIVLHHTASSTLDSTINQFQNPAVQASAHYVVDTNGDIYQLVPDDKRAWHAGVSTWKARVGLNDTAIGIEMINIGNTPFPEPQMNSVINLVKYLKDFYKILPLNIVGHADISLSRKYDPSGYFEWKKLYKALNLFPGLFDFQQIDKQVLIDSSTKKISIKSVQERLKQVGYAIDITDHYDTQTASAFHAFNQHFVPEIFIRETISNQMMVVNQNNNKWYGISEQKLVKLLTF